MRRRGVAGLQAVALLLCRPSRAAAALCSTSMPTPPRAVAAAAASVPPPQEAAASATTDGVQTSRAGHQGGRSVKKHKVRHHVNPLRSNHQGLLDLDEEWSSRAFADATRPLHVDIGCARGLWPMDLARARPEMNVLGLEIRQILADAAQEDAEALGLLNLKFLGCNANVNLEHLLARAGAGTVLASASLQFPDPWFKAKHHKRRTLQPPLVRTLAAQLQPGGFLLLQTDVLEVAEEMRAMVREHAAGVLDDARPDVADWSAAKPESLGGLTTERERACFDLGRPIYRALFTKTHAAQPS